MEFIILIILSSILGVFVAKNIKHKTNIKNLEKYIKKYQDVIIKQNELLNTYRETVNRYEHILNGEGINETPKINRYDLDDILNEISEIGISNISTEKLKFLKNYKKWK